MEYAEDLEGLAVERALVIPSEEGVITLPVYNCRGVPLQVKSGQVMGQAQPVEVTEGSSTTAEQRDVSANVNLLSGVVVGLTEERRRELCAVLRMDQSRLTFDERDAMM